MDKVIGKAQIQQRYGILEPKVEQRVEFGFHAGFSLSLSDFRRPAVGHPAGICTMAIVLFGQYFILQARAQDG